MVAREFLRDAAQLQAVMGYVDGLAGVGIDARPDDVGMLAALLDVEDDGARLADQLQAALGAGDEVEILFAGEVVFLEVGIDGKGIEIFRGARSPSTARTIR